MESGDVFQPNRVAEFRGICLQDLFPDLVGEIVIFIK